MTLPQLSPDAQALIPPFCYLGWLMVALIIRILFLARTNRRLAAQHEKMEAQVLAQQRDANGARQDSHAWRGTVQTQFDAFRAESSRRLEDSEMRYDQMMKQQEARMTELQTMLSQALARVPLPAAEPLPSTPAAQPSQSSVLLGDVVLPRIEEDPVH